MAGALLSGVLVTYLYFAAENLSGHRKTEAVLQSILLAEQEMETIKRRLTENYDTDIEGLSGDLGNDYLAVRTVTNVSVTLKRIQLEVGRDLDHDGSLDPDEVLITLDTQHAQR